MRVAESGYGCNFQYHFFSTLLIGLLLSSVQWIRSGCGCAVPERCRPLTNVRGSDFVGWQGSPSRDRQGAGGTALNDRRAGWRPEDISGALAP